MAATKTSRNDTPNTPDVNESKIARMKVDDLRRELKSRGVKGTAELKKPELVKKMIKLETSGTSSKSRSASAKKSVSASSSKGSTSKAAKSSSSKGASSSSKASVSAKVSSSSKKNSSGSKKNPTRGNDTPNTPDVNESKIARMKVDDLRRELKSRGVKGTADLKKPELVKKMIKASTSSASGAKKSTSSASGTKKSTSSASSTKKSTSSASGGKKSASSASGGKKSASSAKKTASSASGGKKSASSAKKTTSSASGAKKTTSSAKSTVTSASGTKPNGTKGSGGKRTGKATSDSLKYAQEIKSVADKPEREGRSLVTTDHEVIRQWAEARKAVPATVEGTEHDGHLGVLRLNFPGYSGDRLTEVSWDDWFDAFDKRRLNFIYQQKQTSGKRSNFFQLENPDE